MHTFDVRPPAFRSARNDEPNFTSEKPPQTDERFGEVMNRALAGNPRETNRDDAEPPPRDTHAAAGQKNQAVKTKKPLPRDSAADNDATQAAITANPNAQHLSQSTDAQTASDEDDDGSSDEASESDNDKGKPATTSGKTADASKSTAAQLLGVAGPLPAPSPVSTQVTTEGKASKDTKGNSTGGLCATKHAEAPDAAAGSDSKSAEAKDSTDPGEKVLTASDTPAKDPAESKPSPDKGVPASALASAADPAGTSAAKQYTTMKKADKMQKVAGPAEQDLPGDAIKGSEELPMAQKISASALLHSHEKLDLAVTVDSQPATAVSGAPEPAAVAASPAVSPAAGLDDRLRVLERTHDIVALHAMRLGQSGSDSLHVVVKPGGGIQLSLELRQGEGFIEVNASLHKGDFAHLSQYWPELQQRLEARGVRVGDLACSENLSDTGHQEFQQPKQQQSPDQDPLHAGAFAEFALAGSLREAPATRAARATAYRGWESWA
ncbi:MAG TPA: hypothetical protein VH597_17345 [Verrucomicrobiae bacterium]|jgi:hypothetical protein|nr:hypothetical protein [Verrucomicrobiae bacterium]